MSVKVITYSFDNKELWVGVNLEYDGTTTHVTNIQFEGSGKTADGIPKNPNFNEEDGEWWLFENTLSNVDGNETIVSQRIDNEHTQHLVKEILKIRDESTPNFFS